jgi:hypothetical protein
VNTARLYIVLIARDIGELPDKHKQGSLNFTDSLPPPA